MERGDVRIKKLAKLLVEHSCGVKKGERVLIEAGIQARHLILELQKEILKKGAYPRLAVGFEGLESNYYTYASEEQLKKFPELDFNEMKESDSVIVVSAPENRFELQNVDPKKLVLRKKVYSKILSEFLKKKWVKVSWPVEDYAKDAGMSLKEYENFFFKSCLQNYSALSRKMAKVKNLLDKGNEVHIVSGDTNLWFGIKGKNAVAGNGVHNVPDGEVWTAPEEKTTEGHVTFTYPYFLGGTKIEGVYLRFEKGQVVEAHAEKNEHALKSLLKTDEGIKRLGEFGVGCNPNITKFTNQLLFDEKILGTIHLALGNSYRENLGVNRSAIHADIVKDFRKPYGGKVLVDGKLLIKDGKLMV